MSDNPLLDTVKTDINDYLKGERSKRIAERKAAYARQREMAEKNARILAERDAALSRALHKDPIFIRVRKEFEETEGKKHHNSGRKPQNK